MSCFRSKTRNTFVLDNSYCVLYVSRLPDSLTVYTVRVFNQYLLYCNPDFVIHILYILYIQCKCRVTLLYLYCILYYTVQLILIIHTLYMHTHITTYIPRPIGT